MSEVPHIGEYAAIGDGRSVALVSRAGSIDWLCWPRFDSPSLFAAILDPARGGLFRIAPTGRFDSHRSYARDTNVLETTFVSRGGEVRLIDFMPLPGGPSGGRGPAPERELVRILEGIRGEMELEVRFEPRPGYGGSATLTSGSAGIRLEHERALYTLRSDRPLELREDGTAMALIRLRAGERCTLSLSYDREAPAALPDIGAASLAAAERTRSFWRTWASRCTYTGPYRDAVVRSLLALKLLAYAPSGAIVAAATTSLPEKLGGTLNWDYRFAWMRDAALTMRVLFDLGYPEEGRAFASWLLHTTRLTRPEICVLYDVYGRLPDEERVLDNLAGHRGSGPVRVGNAAASQFQLDTYGEVIDAVAIHCRHGEKLDRQTQDLLRDLGRYVCENWPRPDHGIWEERGEPQHHTVSRVLCWTALDRLLELHRDGLLDRIPADRFAENRALIHREVEARGFSERLGSYTDLLDGHSVDASLLLLSWVGFADAGGQRMAGTYRLIRERLEAAPALFYRYERSRRDGEGIFAIVSFWAAEFLARGGGSLAAAERSLERLLTLANDVGLYAEEIELETGEALGNLPQAFSHVGLISAALAIEERRQAEVGRAPAGRPPATEQAVWT